MNFETIKYQKAVGRGLIVFDRPDKLNALNRKVIEELTIIFNEAEKDPEVKVLILTGGNYLFGVGADIQMLSRKSGFDLLECRFEL